MRLEAPLVPDAAYVARLAALGARLDSVHFPLFGSGLDARQQESPDQAATLSALTSLPGVSAYALLNGRMLPPERYLDQADMTAIARRLEQLIERADLKGIVIADFHLLNALSEAAPGICAQLEAVPSVNAMIDSPGRLRAVAEVIEHSAFARPSRVVLDRSLNRDIPMLERTVSAVRKRIPGAAVVLLANEGCLPHCPFKASHNGHIAMVNQRLCAERTHEANRRFACLPVFFEQPERILASPFIRPEDAFRYDGLADVLKICGRTRGGGFLSRAVEAYDSGRWDGNLLDLLDAVGDAADQLEMDNAGLPDDFLTFMSRCELDCARCGMCRPMLQTAFRRKGLSL